MNISERTIGSGITILDIDGPVTLGPGADRLGDKVRSVLQQGNKKLVVNLARVGYMDSAGLGELVHAYTTAAKQGAVMKLIGVTKRLNDLLVITKLSTVFESFDTEDAAIASFGTGA